MERIFLKNMRDNYKKINPMELEDQKTKSEYTKGNLKMERSMERGNFFGKMGINTWETTKTM